MNRIACLLACACTVTVVRPAANPTLPQPTNSLGQVLEVHPLPDADLLWLRDGTRHTGRLLNETFRLLRSEGPLVLRAQDIAALECADGRGSPDVVVTSDAGRLSGWLEEATVRLEPGSGQPLEVRRERVHRLIRAHAPLLFVPSANTRVVLRNGDFFTGSLPEGFSATSTEGQTFVWGKEPVVEIAFPQGAEGPARLKLKDGNWVQATPAREDLRIQLGIGPVLSIYIGHLEELLPADPLPARLARRIGAVSNAPGERTQTGEPDPAVTPVPGMTWIRPGEFLMGSPPDERGRDQDEGPQTRVVFPGGFWIGQHEVTQAEYESVMGHNPSQYAGKPDHPVEKVHWQDATQYCRKLTERERAAGHLPPTHAYRLPTEAEWEYACRAGTSGRFSHGQDLEESQLPEFAWFNQNSDSTTHPVGRRKPNPWGLHDVHGNVCEWCLDDWHGTLPGGTVTNTPTPPRGTLRAARGGSWLYASRFARSANRDSYGLLNRCSDVGFRIVLAPSP